MNIESTSLTNPETIFLKCLDASGYAQNPGHRNLINLVDWVYSQAARKLTIEEAKVTDNSLHLYETILLNTVFQHFFEREINLVEDQRTIIVLRNVIEGIGTNAQNLRTHVINNTAGAFSPYLNFDTPLALELAERSCGFLDKAEFWQAY